MAILYDTRGNSVIWFHSSTVIVIYSAYQMVGELTVSKADHRLVIYVLRRSNPSTLYTLRAYEKEKKIKPKYYDPVKISVC